MPSIKSLFLICANPTRYNVTLQKARENACSHSTAHPDRKSFVWCPHFEGLPFNLSLCVMPHQRSSLWTDVTSINVLLLAKSFLAQDEKYWSSHIHQFYLWHTSSLPTTYASNNRDFCKPLKYNIRLLITTAMNVSLHMHKQGHPSSVTLHPSIIRNTVQQDW